VETPHRWLPLQSEEFGEFGMAQSNDAKFAKKPHGEFHEPKATPGPSELLPAKAVLPQPHTRVMDEKGIVPAAQTQSNRGQTIV